MKTLKLSIIFQILLHRRFFFYHYHNDRDGETLGEIEIREVEFTSIFQTFLHEIIFLYLSSVSSLIYERN